MKKIILFVFCSFALTTIKAQTQVTFYTTMGDFVVEMEDALAPITSTNFIDLVNQKFYDGIIFHRVIDDFIIQGGDPTGTGFGGSGVTIMDEFDPALSNVEKTISMANSGPNTGTSQFFFNMKDNTGLDFDKAPLTSKHPVFGKVVSGWDIVEDIEIVAVNGSNKPLVDVIMDSLRVRDFPLSDNTLSTTKKEQIKIYPNPASKLLNISSKNSNNKTIKILDILGSEIFFTKTIKATTQLDISSYSKGIYFIKVESDNGISTQKIIVQ